MILLYLRYVAVRKQEMLLRQKHDVAQSRIYFSHSCVTLWRSQKKLLFFLIHRNLSVFVPTLLSPTINPNYLHISATDFEGWYRVIPKVWGYLGLPIK